MVPTAIAGSSLHNGPGVRHDSEDASRWSVPPRNASHDLMSSVAGRGYDPLVSTHDALAIDGGTPVRTVPLEFSKGSALLGGEEADALAAVIAERSLFRYKGGLTGGTVAEFE